MLVDNIVNNHPGEVLDSKNGFDIIDCLSCGFKHIIPIPTQEELDGVYKQEYYSKEKPLYLERVREDSEWWELVYSDRYDTLEEMLPAHRRSILDVGSGPGFFLLHGKNRGWRTVGIEPSFQAAAHSRKLGLEVLEEFLTEKSAGQLGAFDAVHMSEVMEHISNPTGMLQIVKQLLTRGGVLCIVVPNDYNPFQYALRKACGYGPWWMAPPHHINYFDFNSLGQLLERNGFKVVLKEAMFPIDIFLLMGDNYVGNDKMGRQCHAKRKAFEHNMAIAGLNTVKRKLYEAFASCGLGRDIVLFARRKD